MRTILITVVALVTLNSCGSYIGKMHREFDNADGKRRVPKDRGGDQFDFYRNQQDKKSANKVSTSDKKILLPQVKRQYQEEKRIKADDLNDNGSAGSLWVGSGDDNFLFTNNRKKSNGDIVLIDVESRLKNEITAELRRAFPEKKRLTKKKDTEGKAPTDKENNSGTEDTETAASPTGDSSKDQVFDRISSIVIEEINKDHILLRGRKFLLYQNHKRLVEIQALVPRREVTDADTVSSTNIIESTVNVIR